MRPVVQSRRVRSFAAGRASSMPLMNFTDSSVLNVRASSSASLMTTAAGVSRLAQQLADRQPQDQPIEDRHPLGPPALGGVGDQRRRCASSRRHGVARERASANARTSSGGSARASGHCGPRTCRRRRARRAGRPPTGRASAAPPRARDARRSASMARSSRVTPRGCAESRDAASAISMRGRRGLPSLVGRPVARARSSASSTELVVSTPNAIGTPVAAAAAVSPCATADAMYSKCGVSPRMRQPRQTTASKRARLRRALRRDRNLERARARGRPSIVRRRRRPSRAPPTRRVSSRSVTKSLISRDDDREAEAGRRAAAPSTQSASPTVP